MIRRWCWQTHAPPPIWPHILTSYERKPHQEEQHALRFPGLNEHGDARESRAKDRTSQRHPSWHRRASAPARRVPQDRRHVGATRAAHEARAVCGLGGEANGPGASHGVLLRGRAVWVHIAALTRGGRHHLLRGASTGLGQTGQTGQNRQPRCALTGLSLARELAVDLWRLSKIWPFTMALSSSGGRSRIGRKGLPQDTDMMQSQASERPIEVKSLGHCKISSKYPKNSFALNTHLCRFGCSLHLPRK